MAGGLGGAWGRGVGGGKDLTAGLQKAGAGLLDED